VKRVLLVSYHFPPIGGAGVQRNVAFARLLPEFGYRPVVLTGPGGGSQRWTPVDETLSDARLASAQIERVPGPVPPWRTGWSDRAERWLGLRSPFSRWWTERVVSVGKGLEDIDVICASMSPYESGEASAVLARELGVPWVADLRDPWALDEMMIYPTRVHRRREVWRMGGVLASADAIVMNTPEAVLRARRAFPEFEGKRVLAIPNGFEGEDFAGGETERTNGAFRIVHTGYLHTALGLIRERKTPVRRLLGGDVPGVRILTRSHVFLLAALQRVRELRPDLGGLAELHLAGVLSERDRAVDGIGVVREHGYLPHDESVALLRSADLLFLPMHDLPPGTRATIVPGKTYEYLGSGRPILGAVPDGDARDLLVRAENTLLCRPADVDEMTRLLLGELERFRAEGRAPSVVRQAAAPYERRRLTEQLAGLFDEVLARPSHARARAAVAAG
jgi:glycosyltransferase involved in cell wall biosynthesis